MVSLSGRYFEEKRPVVVVVVVVVLGVEEISDSRVVVQTRSKENGMVGDCCHSYYYCHYWICCQIRHSGKSKEICAPTINKSI